MLRFFRKMRKALVPENRFGRYFFYATGEIVLVVIGILIALQINNWNEEKKKDKLRVNYVQSLIEDLKQDTTYINEIIEKIEGNRSRLWNYRKRIVASDHALDTLVQIARYEYVPFMDERMNFNSATFTALQSSGNIDLLDPWINQALLELNFKHKKALKLADDNMQGFMSTVKTHLQKYPLNIHGMVNGKEELDTLVWNNIDKRDLVISFNAIIAYQLQSLRNTMKNLNEIKVETVGLLDKLQMEYS